jgi:hypothetical protein
MNIIHLQHIIIHIISYWFLRSKYNNTNTTMGLMTEYFIKFQIINKQLGTRVYRQMM